MEKTRVNHICPHHYAFHQNSSHFSLFFIPSNLCMGYFLFFPTIFLVFPLVSGFPLSEFIRPNFTSSKYQLIDNNGAFLSSHNGTFTAAIVNPSAQQTNFYLCVIHVASNTIIWSANRDAPISESGTVTLTTKGIAIADQDGKPGWSTPPLQSSVYTLLLTEMGNLVLLDHSNGSLWESFHYPTDTIVIGQHLPVGTYLSSARSDYDLSSGDYRLTVSTSDALLQWYQQTYWKLSMDTKAYINSNYIVEYMAINRTGLYLFGRNELVVVIQLILPPADFRIAKLGASGQFSVSRYFSANWVQEFLGPDDDCKIPFICGQIGLCTYNPPSSTPICSCPLGFHVGSQNMSGCVPSDGSYSLPFACNSTNNDSQLNSSLISYLWLGYRTEYFSTEFYDPLKYNVSLSVCEDLCSRDCSCLGIFYENSSGSCYVLENELGSIISGNADESDLQGYIKTLVGSNTPNPNGSSSSSNERQKVPVAALVLLPFTGFFLLVALGFLLWRRWRLSKSKEIKLRCCSSHSSEDLDSFYIPGLPKRFYYEELDMHEQGKYLELADPRLQGRVTREEVEKLVRVALCCLHEEPMLRPNMVNVVGMLEGGTPLAHPVIESLNFLRFYGRRFTEASTIMEPSGSMPYPLANASTSTTNGFHTDRQYEKMLKDCHNIDLVDVIPNIKHHSVDEINDVLLVKNTFLKNERTLPRKIVEMVLALALERTMSKRRILSCYVNKIYWGHGIYDIKSASLFYFGKHPSLLSLGESAMLAGIIPAPELRSPLRDLNRGKTFQARVLRRMVEVGSLDVETALSVVKQSLQLRVDMSEYSDGLLHLLPFSKEGLDASSKLNQGGTVSILKDVWNWERESKILEAWEDMERWAIKVGPIKHGTSAKKFWL
ncbi:hypothetical protein FH972_015985 [Carpinus fangiana]|uniref:Bulb-type lectin domain-containing protein n=1 Tax=Carpinus fangiana TaxID=176857 RepID=A0A5N6RHS1_9ROSI|nr:hypothetical protein FH972_015985 [Carpinus fangiana]